MQPPKSHIEERLETEIKGLTRDDDATRPKKRVALSDQNALLSLDLGDVLCDRVVFDDPEP
jgi:hypothetical protein